MCSTARLTLSFADSIPLSIGQNLTIRGVANIFSLIPRMLAFGSFLASKGCAN